MIQYVESGRQTGKTTRMLNNLAAQLKAGRNATVVAYNRGMVGHIKLKLSREHPELTTEDYKRLHFSTGHVNSQGLSRKLESVFRGYLVELSREKALDCGDVTFIDNAVTDMFAMKVAEETNAALDWVMRSNESPITSEANKDIYKIELPVR